MKGSDFTWQINELVLLELINLGYNVNEQTSELIITNKRKGYKIKYFYFRKALKKLVRKCFIFLSRLNIHKVVKKILKFK